MASSTLSFSSGALPILKPCPPYLAGRCKRRSKFRYKSCPTSVRHVSLATLRSGSRGELHESCILPLSFKPIGDHSFHGGSLQSDTAIIDCPSLMKHAELHAIACSCLQHTMMTGFPLRILEDDSRSSSWECFGICMWQQRQAPLPHRNHFHRFGPQVVLPIEYVFSIKLLQTSDTLLS